MNAISKWAKNEGLPTKIIILVGLILISGSFLVVWRFASGLGAVTNLNDYQPWGFWVGFDVLCGVALAAGGFVLTGIVHLLNFERYKSLVRATVLNAFLGYILVSIGLLVDLGKPWNIWHPLVMWNPHSVMFEVAWCVMLYTAVLSLEFSPVILEKFNRKRELRVIRSFTLPLVIAGVLLSTLHQSSLGTVFLVVPNKLHPLWYTGLLPLHFWLSAVTVGFAVIIVESTASHALFKKSLRANVMADLGQFMTVGLILTLAVRFQDLYSKISLAQIFNNSIESTMFIIEMLLFITPLALMIIFRNRMKQWILVSAAGLVMMAVVLNRLNVSITGMARAGHFSYFPSWQEIAITGFLVTVEITVFLLCVRYLPIFPREKGEKH